MPLSPGVRLGPYEILDAIGAGGRGEVYAKTLALPPRSPNLNAYAERWVRFYKGRSQEKTHLLRLEFFLLPSPRDRARSVLNFRAMDSGAGNLDPAVWIFSPSGFHRFLATKPVSSETSKQYDGQVVTIVLSGTRGP